jgi:putative DNA primase/helicase
VTPGGRFKAWREVEHAILRNLKCQVFVRGPRLVEPLWRFEQDDDGGEVLACQFVRYNMLRLSDVVARHAAVFMKFTATGKQRPIDPPADVIETLLVRQDWQFPTVVGIVNTPTMRPDGSLLTQPGYDRQTRLWYKSSGEVKLPSIPERPTKEDAQRALELLKGLLKGFPFDGQVSQSVALAAMFTTALRGVLRIAPIFAVIAPDPRTGKTFLVNLLCVLATGHRPVPSAGSRDSNELEKRIETAALSGRAVMHLNNLQNGMVVESERLSELCTEGQVYIRTLGRHEEGLCDCRGTTIFLNGNNIVMAADLVPRTAVCRLDAKMENPGSRMFEFDPIELVRRDRSNYLAGIFTIVRAFMAAGSPGQEGMTRVAGFEAWSRFVQQPLVWLGEADPLGGMEDARALDPTIEELRQLIEVLRKCFPAGNQFFTVADCARLAEEMDHDSWGRPRYKRQDLRDVMTFHGKVNTKSFGWLIKRHRDRVVDGWSIRVAGGKERKDSNTYYLEGPTRQAPAQEDQEIM